MSMTAAHLTAIHRILVTVDGSPHARRAADLAATIAVRFEAETTLLHVLLKGTPYQDFLRSAGAYDIPAETLERLAPAVPAVYDDSIGFPMAVMNPAVPTALLVELGRRILETHRDAVQALGVKGVALMMEDGDPAETILRVAGREKADLIVLGHRGLGAFRELFAGSVSTKVNHLSPTTVVAVK